MWNNILIRCEKMCEFSSIDVNCHSWLVAIWFRRKMKRVREARFAISCSKPVNWAPLPASQQRHKLRSKFSVSTARRDRVRVCPACSLRGFCWRVNHGNGVSRNLPPLPPFSPSSYPWACAHNVHPILFFSFGSNRRFRTFIVFLLKITARKKKMKKELRRRGAIPRTRDRCLRRH